IRVPTFVSPILKWPAPGKQPTTGKVDFAFDPASCPSEDPLEYACDVAGVLGAARVRFFSYLRHDGFKAADLVQPIERLMDLAGMLFTFMHLENEPVGNIGSIAELADFFRQIAELFKIMHGVRAIPVQPLLDIGNSYAMGAIPTDRDIAMLAPHVDTIHL